ncbi:MAG: hypothetical protein JNL70_13630 [Saprospiraceae bacterium]|nr:hypothetical protein [Saprospiraceae bacterium]
MKFHLAYFNLLVLLTISYLNTNNKIGINSESVGIRDTLSKNDKLNQNIRTTMIGNIGNNKYTLCLGSNMDMPYQTYLGFLFNNSKGLFQISGTTVLVNDDTKLFQDVPSILLEAIDISEFPPPYHKEIHLSCSNGGILKGVKKDKTFSGIFTDKNGKTFNFSFEENNDMAYVPTQNLYQTLSSNCFDSLKQSSNETLINVTEIKEIDFRLNDFMKIVCISNKEGNNIERIVDTDFTERSVYSEKFAKKNHIAINFSKINTYCISGIVNAYVRIGKKIKQSEAGFIYDNVNKKKILITDIIKNDKLDSFMDKVRFLVENDKLRNDNQKLLHKFIDDKSFFVYNNGIAIINSSNTLNSKDSENTPFYFYLPFEDIALFLKPEFSNLIK